MSGGAPYPGVELTLHELLALAGDGGRLALRRRRPLPTDGAPGDGRTPNRLRGMEFSGLRAYQSGDDVRHMAWRATARTGRPQVREFHGETDRPVMLCVDLGESMRFATRGAFKSVVAARAAALLGWDAAGRGDRVGGVVCDGSGLRSVRPAARRGGVLSLLHALVELHGSGSAGASGLMPALAGLDRHLPRGARLFILSDFLDLDAQGEQLLARLSRRCELLLLRVCDPLEVAPPVDGCLRIGDAAGALTVDGRNSTQRDAYCAAWAALDTQLDRLCGARGGRIRLRTDQPLPARLAGLLKSLDGVVSGA